MTILIIIALIYFSSSMLGKFFKENSIHKTIVGKMDFIFLLRPTSLFIVWILISLGMYLAQFANNNLELFSSDFSFKTFLFYVSASLMSTIFIINNQLDKTDGKYLIKEKFNLELIDKSKKTLLVFAMFSVLYPCWFFSLVYLFLYLIYERLYIKNKSNVVFSFVYNSCLIIIFIFLGVFYQIFQKSLIFNVDIILLSLPYILSIFSIYLFKESYGSVDLDIKNLSSYLSKMNISFIGFCFTMFSLITSFLLKDPLASTILIISIFFLFYTLIRGLQKDFIRSIRYSIGIFVFFISTVYPLIILPTIIVFYLSKYYYWHRFNIHYPTFLVSPNTFCALNIKLKSKYQK